LEKKPFWKETIKQLFLEKKKKPGTKKEKLNYLKSVE